MKGAPEYRNWAPQLRSLAEAPELACVREPLLALADNSLTNLDPLNEFIHSKIGDISQDDLWQASERIETAIPQQPLGALLASMVALMVWLTRMDKQLYSQINGMPPPGWIQFPYVCAKAAFAAGAANEALQMVDLSMDVLNAAKYRYGQRYDEAVARYRQLGVLVETRWRSAYEDLANDLRDSCRLEQPNFRAEVGALLWTLGMVPESGLFLPGAPNPGLPPLRLCRWIANVSNIGMARDPLTQYIWLEMKDREPFNIRDHPVFFGRANLRYTNHMLDEVMPEPPSQLFAKTAIAWFRGDLEEKLAGDYIEAYQLVEEEFPNSVDWPIYFRMRMLALMVGNRFGWIGELSPAKELGWMQDLVNQAASVNRNTFVHPAWPELYTRTSGPVFFALDKLAAGSASDSAADCVATLERFRAASLKYWLTVAAPLPSEAEATAVAQLLEQEAELLTELKGAYFLVLSPILPMHYQRSARVWEPNDPSPPKAPEAGKGLDEYKRILDELTALYAQMQPLAPEYVQRRTAPAADVASLANALGMHRSKSESVSWMADGH